MNGERLEEESICDLLIHSLNNFWVIFPVVFLVQHHSLSHPELLRFSIMVISKSFETQSLSRKGGFVNFLTVFVCYIKLTINLGIIIIVINSTDQQFNELQISNLFLVKPMRWAFHKVCFGSYFVQLQLQLIGGINLLSFFSELSQRLNFSPRQRERS